MSALRLVVTYKCVVPYAWPLELYKNICYFFFLLETPPPIRYTELNIIT